ncbi:glycoside hydrolase family 16 protein [Fodinibius salsisoli]|uniref:Glycoside hydrolase family 16 protein n=1 Tax=Fodinibius salsisoli TaxID=2820877 RepID=A0ABT3PQH7_9BACT|nr:glycoside hydrolase family 16 protein [Fodinibius salsisoli]MCW9708124.1 glycoside hydrolase family 16 protein [Fodinibius salsisoli]
MISKILVTMAVLMGISCNSSAQSVHKSDDAPSKPGYTLVWHDEFNEGNKPDTSNWSYEHGFVRNEELQWYQKDNATIQEGKLVIEGRREQVPNTSYDSTSNDWRENRQYAKYTSSSINTRGKQEFKYGIIEVRAKIDTANGMWPAIWTLGTHEDRDWPANGEVDIMEFYKVDGQQTILANAAWASEQKWEAVWDDQEVPFSTFLEKDPQWPEKFHIWKMHWTKESIRLYLDDELLNEIDLEITLNPDGFNPFHQPHYILLNLALGSNGGDPSDTAFPKQYKVDYVRVYQRN